MNNFAANNTPPGSPNANVVTPPPSIPSSSRVHCGKKTARRNRDYAKKVI